MYAHQITASLADARRQDLIAEARAHRLGRASREAADPRHGTATFAFRFRVVPAP
jgi:hypothetical protein